MTILELEAELARGKIAPLYLFYGTERFLMQQALQKLTAQVVDPAVRDFNVQQLLGSEASASQLIDMAAALPMMSRYRLIVVKDAEPLFQGDVAPLLAYLENPVSTTCLVFCATKIDARKKFFVRFKKAGVLVECMPLRRNQLIPYLTREAQRWGKRLPLPVAEELIEVAGTDLSTLVQEVQKVATYAPHTATIRREDVIAVCGHSRLETVFALVDAICAKEPGKALSHLAHLLEHGEAPVKIVFMITRQFRLLLKARHLVSRGVPRARIAAELSMRPFMIEKLFTQMANFTEAEIVAALHRLARADLEQKSLRTSRHHQLEHLIVELCLPASRR